MCHLPGWPAGFAPVVKRAPECRSAGSHGRQQICLDRPSGCGRRYPAGARLNNMVWRQTRRREVTLRGLFAMMAAVVWAIFWWPVGRQFGWWAGAAGFASGGFAGLVIGWLF